MFFFKLYGPPPPLIFPYQPDAPRKWGTLFPQKKIFPNTSFGLFVIGIKKTLRLLPPGKLVKKNPPENHTTLSAQGVLYILSVGKEKNPTGCFAMAPTREKPTRRSPIVIFVPKAFPPWDNKRKNIEIKGVPNFRFFLERPPRKRKIKKHEICLLVVRMFIFLDEVGFFKSWGPPKK